MFIEFWEGAVIDHFRHPIKIHQQTQKNFICRWAVFMNPAEIAQDGDARNILPMESKNTGVLLTQPRSAFWWWYMPMQVFMLTIIRRRNFRQ